MYWSELKKKIKTKSDIIPFLFRFKIQSFYYSQDHLVCFIAGTLALGTHFGLSPEHLQLGKDLAYTCYQTYVKMPTRLSPEITYFNLAPGARDDLIVKVTLDLFYIDCGDWTNQINIDFLKQIPFYVFAVHNTWLLVCKNRILIMI